jgi:alkanesulfonate monooxygenase SsuD/methylene tetrahydromethanopterin reductase-like flavin-dependent oxidoreductase (luciferase family)
MLAAARLPGLGETIGEEDGVHYGVSVPNFGVGVDARAIAELAREAEEAGWEGFFLWDHLLAFSPGPVPVVDPWVALTAVALSTSRVRLGPMVTPLPRRRPAKLARETASLDHLSGGRLILGVGIGAMPYEWDYLGEEPDARVRGAMLDEGLEVLAGLWTGESFRHRGGHYRVAGEPPNEDWRAVFYPPPLQRPRVPIWVAGTWPVKAPFRRAARWDGVFPMKVEGGRIAPMTPEDVQGVACYVAEHREPSADPFELVVAGETPGEDRQEGARTVAAYEEAGVTWWVESIDPWRFGWTGTGTWPSEQMRHRVRQGPPEA